MSRSHTPYSDLPAESFWRTGVADPGPFGIKGLARPGFAIAPQDRITTFGSCFAQRLSQAVQERGFAWLDAEPAPPMMTADTARRFNYGVFSARTGNIYTAAVLRQWVSWALDGDQGPPEIWETEDGRVEDAMRPGIEPGGFADRSELTRAWSRTLAAITRALTRAQAFVFTMGLTEAWQNTRTGLVYPTCPGTVAGRFDPEAHALVNFEYEAVRADLDWVITRLLEVNPQMKVILTVSPVPLTATAEPDTHALVANTYTKSLLRTVAGSLARAHSHVDYFPGYEMVATAPFRGMFYAPNQRSVDMFGVRYVMEAFVRAYAVGQAVAPPPTATDDADLVCDDMILEFYNDR